MNWNQTGMPSALVSRLGQKREIAEFKSVLTDAQNQVLCPVDVESMAQELVESGGREFVDMVRELTTGLANAKRELEESNRRYERLAAELKRRGISISEDSLARQKPDCAVEEPATDISSGRSKSSEEALAEWEEWNRRFQSLLC